MHKIGIWENVSTNWDLTVKWAAGLSTVRSRVGWPQLHTSRAEAWERLAHLGDAVLVGHDADNVIQWEQRVALYLCVDVLALGAHGQELHQVDVVHERAVLVHPVPLWPHHLDQGLERGSVVVEHEDVLSRINQLYKEQGLFILQACGGGDTI